MSNRLKPKNKWLEAFIIIGLVLLIAAVLGSFVFLSGKLNNESPKEDIGVTDSEKEPEISSYRGTGLYANDSNVLTYDVPPEVSDKYSLHYVNIPENWSREGEEDGNKYWEVGRTNITSSTKNVLTFFPAQWNENVFHFETDIRFVNASHLLTDDCTSSSDWIAGIRFSSADGNDYLYFFADGDKMLISHSDDRSNIIAEIPMNVWYNVRMEVNDWEYKVYINNELATVGTMSRTSAKNISNVAFEIRYFATDVNIHLDNTFASAITE